MKTFFDNNFKYIITAIILIWLAFNLVDMFTRTNGMSNNDKERIKKLNQEIEVLIENQKKLDESINSYKQEITKIDSNIANIKVKKEVVNNFYGQKQKEIKDSNTKQIDSMFRLRYNY
jgi:chromosome segregation ATPase